MKKFFTSLFFTALILLTGNINAQIINLNPDPNGEPWIAGDATPTPPDIEITIPIMVLSPASAATELPTVVDNSDLIYMPPVFNQGASAACVQVAEIWYSFAYEINRLRNVDAGDGINNLTNLYHPFYTYNFLNGGNGQNGTTLKSGFRLIEDNGCPSYDVYDDPALHNGTDDQYIYWMNQHDNYQNGMHNKISGIENIEWDSSYASLETLKHWVTDHNSGDTTGGLAIISVYTHTWITYYPFPPGTPEEGKHYVSQWGTTGGHALTIVGYNDDVQCFDINGDGIYENQDFDGDGIVELDECEKGAFKVVNSWGTVWRDSGYIYVPYKLLATGLQVNHRAYVCNAIEESTPELTVKTNIEHTSRNRLQYRIGYAEHANAHSPVQTTNFKSFSFQGGSNDMRGAYTGPIESGLDFGYWYGNDDFGKIYFIINEHDANNQDYGTIESFSIVDYRWGDEFELTCDQTNVPIVNHGLTTLYIDYDLLVPGDNQIINQDKTLFSNMVSRFQPTVNNNATLTIQNAIKLDMYNSTLTINEGSTLVIGDNATITAKRGVSKIIVNGNIQIGNNVTFTADEGSTIEIYLNNNQAVSIANCIFNNCKLNNSTETLTVSQCNFTNSYLTQSVADLSVNESDFANSSILASNPTMGPLQINNNVTISNCDFVTAFSEANSIIEIYGYKNFEITNNTIDNISNPDNTYHGISVNYSGSNETGSTHNISNNEILCSYGFCDNELSGITIYSSIADISANYVHANKIGIQSLGNSEVTIVGNENAVYEYETQRIKNNSLYQIYASSNAFPTQMHWNAIYSSDNSDCFVFHDVDMSSNPPDVDVSNNYWGPVFDANVNLCPIRHYIYEPIWHLSNNQISLTDAQQLFETGLNQLSGSNYVDAKSTFQQVVTSFPQDEPAVSSLKEVFYLEPLAGNDFSGLKNWYLTDTTILNHDKLLKLAQNLANKCDEKLENYPDAIAWYENIINNPETLQDSIFAIIDLEHLYWQMGIDTNLRSSSYTGNMPQFKPNSFKEFNDKKDELLLLLHGVQSNQTTNEEKNYSSENIEKEGELLQNFPNPFKGYTKISYNLKTKSNVQLKVFSYTGQLIKKIDERTKMKGMHHVDFNANNLTSGIYFYSLFINGQIAETKKMLIMK